MQLSDIDWFKWNGVSCSTYGVHVLSQPTIISPLERAEYVNIPGKSGSLTMLDGDYVYDDINLSITCVIDNPDNVTAITKWLIGKGEIIFASRSEGYYKGRIANQISFEKAVKGNPHHLFTIQFRCEPFFYLNSGKTVISATSSSTQINNVGNVPSAPLLVINGSGDGTIMCGSSTMLIDFGSEERAIADIKLDCEAKIAYRGTAGDAQNPLVLYGTRVTGDWLTIPAGESYFVFSGGVTSASITPRWRCI